MENSSKQSRWAPGSEPLERKSGRDSIEDFAQTYPDIPAEELRMFKAEYILTSEGVFNGMTEDSYRRVYFALHPGYSSDKLVERLAILRDRARAYAEINQNPNRERDLTGVDLVRHDQEIQRLLKKSLDGTITDIERDKLKAL